MIEVKIENCNNIALGTLRIEPNRVNICYAMNGSGKSTIASAIKQRACGEDLSILSPFGLETRPAVAFSEQLTSVLVFNEEFVNSVVFIESDVIQNAFDVFIRTPSYDEKRRELDEALRAIQLETISSPDFDTLRSTGNKVLSKFAVTNSGALKQTGVMKSLISSASLFNLPKEVKSFQPLMDDKERAVEWVGWKIDGGAFDEHEICPFCSEPLRDTYTTEKTVFEESYSKSNVKNVRDLLSYFTDVEYYMDASQREKMFRCIREGTDVEQIKHWVLVFYTDLKYLMEKVKNVVEFNTFELKSSDISNLGDKLNDLKISADDLQVFNNDNIIEIVTAINGQIDALVSKAELLKNQIGNLNGAVNASMKRAIRDVNSFLELADIPYRLDFRGSGEQALQAFLKYVASPSGEIEVHEIKKHLSWGERNAFALVLFMHYALSQDPDLVVLDDPISSFDTNKKYAIISRLFRNAPSIRSLLGSTVLMLTHDFQPIIDFIVLGKPHSQTSTAMFIRNENGQLKTVPLSRADIESMPILLERSARNASLNPVHRVASLRKLMEHTRESSESDPAYNLLSCLIHGEPSAAYRDGTALNVTELASGEASISVYIEGFSFARYQQDYFERDALLRLFHSESVAYFKIQTFRALIAALGLRSSFPDEPILKFIDEQFHVENDYLYYLDFGKFDTVPAFVVDACEAFVTQRIG